MQFVKILPKPYTMKKITSYNCGNTSNTIGDADREGSNGIHDVAEGYSAAVTGSFLGRAHNL